MGNISVKILSQGIWADLAGKLNYANGSAAPGCAAFSPVDASWRCRDFCAWKAGNGKLDATVGEQRGGGWRGERRLKAWAVFSGCTAACVRGLAQLSGERCYSPTSSLLRLPPPGVPSARLEDPVVLQHRGQVPHQHPRRVLMRFRASHASLGCSHPWPAVHR